MAHDRDNYITITRPVVSEDPYGEVTVSSEPTIATAWAKVEELKSRSELEEGKKRITRNYMLTADSRDVEMIDLDDTISIAGRDIDLQINDFYDADDQFVSGMIGSTIIIAEIKE